MVENRILDITWKARSRELETYAFSGNMSSLIGKYWYFMTGQDFVEVIPAQPRPELYVRPGQHAQHHR